VRRQWGRFVTFDAPGASGTIGYGIDAAGTVTRASISGEPASGIVRATTGLSPPSMLLVGHGRSRWLWHQRVWRHSRGSTLTRILPRVKARSSNNINASGTVAGYYVNANNVNHGFLGTE